MKKRLMALGLASVMAMGMLAGCGSSSSAPAATTAAPAATEAAKTEAAKEEKKEEAPASEAAATEAAASDVVWPDGTIDVLIPGAAGSNTDLSARIMLDYLTAKYPNAKFNPIDEKTGNGTLAMEMCRTAKPDGHTIMFTGSGSNIMYHQGKYEYNVMDPDQFTIVAPAAGGNGQGSILLTQPDKPYNNYQEFVDYCKAHPGEVTFATNTGTTQEMKVKLFVMKHDLDVKFVILSGNDLVTALLAGNVDVGLQSENKAAQYIENGDLKGLFNNTHMEDGMSEVTKDIETYYDLGLLDIAFRAPMYVIAPGKMDPALAQKICDVMNEVEQDQASEERWAQMNSWYYAKSLDQIRAEVQSTDEDCAKVIAGELTQSQFGIETKAAEESKAN